jgi:hypothetical protein
MRFKVLYWVLAFAVLIVSSCDENLNPVITDLKKEITVRIDSLTSNNNYYSFYVSDGVPEGKYKVVWDETTDNSYIAVYSYRLPYADSEGLEGIYRGDSLSLSPGQKISVRGSAHVGEWNYAFSFQSQKDTIDCQLTVLRKPLYNYTLEGLRTVPSQRYSVTDSFWESYCTQEYFPLTLSQDGTLNIGTHISELIMPEIYAPITFRNKEKFEIQGESVDIEFQPQSFYYLDDQLLQKYICVDSYSIKPSKLGHSVLEIKKGPYEYTKELFVYEPMILDISVENNYFLSASLKTTGKHIGEIKLNYIIGIELIRESDGLRYLEGEITRGSKTLQFQNESDTKFDKFYDFSEEYVLCKTKMYDTSADKAILKFQFSVDVPFKDVILKGHNFKGIATKGEDFNLVYTKDGFMEVIYD